MGTLTIITTLAIAIVSIRSITIFQYGDDYIKIKQAKNTSNTMSILTLICSISVIYRRYDFQSMALCILIISITLLSMHIRNYADDIQKANIQKHKERSKQNGRKDSTQQSE